MLRILFKFTIVLAFTAAVLSFGAAELRAATITYIVGTCKAGTQFTTIQGALNASPSPNVVQVCPGTYTEQLTITNAVTLEGLSIGNSALIRITPPATGLATNATINGSGHAAVHVFVKNATGEVNLTNLMVDSTGNQVMADIFLVGVFYQHSSGTVNHVIAVHQQAHGLGYGIYMEGGSSNPSVTVENCSVHDFDLGGIFVTGPNGPTSVIGQSGATENVTGQLTAKVENNFVSSLTAETLDMLFGSSTVDTVTGNLCIAGTAFPGIFGMTVEANTGSVVSDNTIIGAQLGIVLQTDGASLKSNKMYALTGDGIQLVTNLKSSQIIGNIIQDTLFDGINLDCKTSGTLVHSNTFEYLATGYLKAPTGFAGSNTYVATQTDVSACP